MKDLEVVCFRNLLIYKLSSKAWKQAQNLSFRRSTFSAWEPIPGRAGWFSLPRSEPRGQPGACFPHVFDTDEVASSSLHSQHLHSEEKEEDNNGFQSAHTSLWTQKLFSFMDTDFGYHTLHSMLNLAAKLPLSCFGGSPIGNLKLVVL